MGLCNAQRKRGCYVFNGVVIGAIALAMIIIGVNSFGADPALPDTSKNACQTIVPWWHIVGGALILMGLFGRIILTRCCDARGQCCDDSSGGRICKCGVKMIYDCSFLGIMGVWLLVGSVGIIPIYNSIIKNSIGIDVSNTVTNAVNSVVGETGIGEIPTAAPSDGAECDKTLYHFTWVVLTAGWILLAVASLFILLCKCLYNVLCCNPCKEGATHV